MMPQWIIEKKRDGGELTSEEIAFMIQGYLGNSIPDYQMSALAMAIFFRGMTPEETANFTFGMLEGGTKLDWPDISKPKIDKHSTGGTGDKISLILAPLAAAAGLAVPMIAGRGLGATGGTIDKLESIPGYRSALSAAEFKSVVRACGCSIISQSGEIAPADRRLYALRDVTGTVPSIPLITASILSKKLSAGLDGLVMDVKWGNGAFMRTRAEARKLAESLVKTAGHAKLRCVALLTDMNQPLGSAIGNAVEVFEAVETLRGKGPPDVRAVTIELVLRMMKLAHPARPEAEHRALLGKLLDSGAAWNIFVKMVELHGGDPRFIESSTKREYQPESLTRSIKADRAGFVARADAGVLGRACLALGAGRRRHSDSIDPAAGLTNVKKIGDPVEQGEPLAMLHAANQTRLDQGAEIADRAFDITDRRPKRTTLIGTEIKQGGLRPQSGNRRTAVESSSYGRKAQASLRSPRQTHCPGRSGTDGKR